MKKSRKIAITSLCLLQVGVIAHAFPGQGEPEKTSFEEEKKESKDMEDAGDNINKTNVVAKVSNMDYSPVGFVMVSVSSTLSKKYNIKKEVFKKKDFYVNDKKFAAFSFEKFPLQDNKSGNAYDVLKRFINTNEAKKEMFKDPGDYEEYNVEINTILGNPYVKNKEEWRYKIRLDIYNDGQEKKDAHELTLEEFRKKYKMDRYNNITLTVGLVPKE